MTFWVDVELGRYLVEALRAWGLHSENWIATDSFDATVADGCFYDISTELAGNSQSFTTTDREIISDLLYQIIEPQITVWPGGWVGTEMFDLPEIVRLLSEARSTYLIDTAQIVGDGLTPQVEQVQGAGLQRVSLDEGTVRVRRVSSQEVGDSLRRPLWTIDTNQAQSTTANAVRPGPGTVSSYLLYHRPQLTFDLYSPPINNVTLRMLNCLSGDILAPTVAPTIINLPDDCAWLLRYKVLADLFAGDGLARAPMMSQYCEQRWTLGLEAVRRYHSVIAAYPQGRQVPPSSLSARDSVRARWESETPGAPRQLALPAWNIVVVWPTPDGTYTIPVDLIQKAPIPVDDDDFVDISPAYMDSIYDYAQHVACLKMQGAEFQATFPLLEEFMENAEKARAIQAAEAPTYWDLERLGSIREENWRPMWKRAAVNNSKAELASSGPSGGSNG